MSHTPLISVVVPTCNRNDLLAKCLTCLAPENQKIAADKYEVIVTDDGTQSSAQQLVEQEFPWAKWTKGPKRGPAANRNHGSAQAKGGWIAFTDDDCLPSPGWLKAFHDAITADTQVYEGKTTCAQGVSSPLFTSPTNETGGLLWSCNMMISRNLFQQLNGFDETFPFAAMEDVDFRDRIHAAGHTFPFIQSAIVDHPPRPVPSGKRRGEMTASEYLYFARLGQPYQLWPTIKFRAYIRLREIVRQRKGWDSIRAVPHLLSELLTIWKLFPTWKDKWGNPVR